MCRKYLYRLGFIREVWEIIIAYYLFAAKFIGKIIEAEPPKIAIATASRYNKFLRQG